MTSLSCVTSACLCTLLTRLCSSDVTDLCIVCGVRVVCRVMELEAQLNAAQNEAHKARELADISVSQLSAITLIQTFSTDEVETLREQARASASQTDDAAIIGKLQRQMMETKAAYQTLSKNHESVRVSLQRARLSVAVLEAAIDEKTAEVLAVKSETTARMEACERMLQTAARHESDVEAFRYSRVHLRGSCRWFGRDCVAPGGICRESVREELTNLRAEVAANRGAAEELRGLQSQLKSIAAERCVLCGLLRTVAPGVVVGLQWVCVHL